MFKSSVAGWSDGIPLAILVLFISSDIALATSFTALSNKICRTNNIFMKHEESTWERFFRHKSGLCYLCETFVLNISRVHIVSLFLFNSMLSVFWNYFYMIRKSIWRKVILIQCGLLNYLFLMHPFSAPWKHQKTFSRPHLYLTGKYLGPYKTSMMECYKNIFNA